MAKIAIYAGHGGSDAGACALGFKEKDLTLDLANGVSAILRGAGHEILQNRTTDVNRNITTDANKANSWGADYVIEFHFNAGGGQGTETYCSIVGGKSRELAERVNNRIASLGFKNRGVKTKTGNDGKDYFGIIRQTKAPCCLVEVCFIDNGSDMGTYNSLPDIANHIADEIHSFVKGGSPNPPSPQPTQMAICNTNGLNVRSGAGVNYKILFKLNKGNCVDVLKSIGEWDYIECNHGKGYCKGCYLDAQ